jgi:hypothetical protein
VPQELPFISTFLNVGSGLETAELEFDDSEGLLDPWADDWLRGRGTRAHAQPVLPRRAAPTDDDPGHKIADDRAKETGVDLGIADLLSIARSQLGAPYVWADANPEGTAGGPGSGFDCSGLTQWVLSRFGVQTTHLAEAQQDQFRKVGRNQLRPGDLIFYNYGRKAPGVADHVAIYIGAGKQIAASSSEGAVAEQSVDWSHFIGGGATGIDAGSGGQVGQVFRPGRGGRGRVAPTVADQPFTLVNASLDDAPPFGPVMAAALQSPTMTAPPRADPERARLGGSVKAQLRQGFLDSGRPDLAKMVYTKDFDAWISAESGWRVDVASQSYPGHGRNYGLFQFWEGHPWTDKYLEGETSWTADAYTQAKLVARYFAHLTPDDIRRYAAQIRAGEYKGWG